MSAATITTTAVGDPNRLGKSLDIRMMLTTPAPQLDFVIPGFLAATVGVAAGPGAAGKSFVVIEAGLAVAAGPTADLLGVKPGHTGKVLYISREDPDCIIHTRLQAIQRYLPPEITDLVADNFSIRAGSGMPLDVLNPRDRAALQAGCEGHRLCIVDTLVRSHSAKENDNDAMAAVLSAFESIAKQTGCAILLTHHVSKASRADGPSDQPVGRGAGAITDNCRWGASLLKMTEAQSVSFADAENPKKEIGDDRGLYVSLNLGMKPNYSPPASGVGGIWLKRHAGGVLLPAHLVDMWAGNERRKGKDKEDKGPHDRRAKRGLGNLVGAGAEEYDRQSNGNMDARASGGKADTETGAFGGKW